ncbi:unnamed protein product, partial [marine sediment metagenome]
MVLRKGGISREPDFIAEIDDDKIELEFQYADKVDLDFYDFKVSKVARKKGGKREPIENKSFIYIHKALLKYAIFSPNWILKNGEYGMVPAWRSFAFRVPKEKFEELLIYDNTLNRIVKIINIKNYFLNFQHELIDMTKEKLSHLLQGVIDENKILKIIPKDLDSFFKVCFILDNINKIPQNANLWLIYILSYVNKDNNLNDISKIVYCIDYLYSKVEMESNEISQLSAKLKELIEKINICQKDDGSYSSSPKVSPFDETRFALF